MKDKNAKNMLKQLKKYFNKIYLTEINNEDHISIEELENNCGRTKYK